jgi:hypothetical protein
MTWSYTRCRRCRPRRRSGQHPARSRGWAARQGADRPVPLIRPTDRSAGVVPRVQVEVLRLCRGEGGLRQDAPFDRQIVAGADHGRRPAVERPLAVGQTTCNTRNATADVTSVPIVVEVEPVDTPVVHQGDAVDAAVRPVDLQVHPLQVRVPVAIAVDCGEALHNARSAGENRRGQNILYQLVFPLPTRDMGPHEMVRSRSRSAMCCTQYMPNGTLYNRKAQPPPG